LTGIPTMPIFEIMKIEEELELLKRRIASLELQVAQWKARDTKMCMSLGCTEEPYKELKHCWKCLHVFQFSDGTVVDLNIPK